MKLNYMTELSATILELPRIINTAVDEIKLYEELSATILELPRIINTAVDEIKLYDRVVSNNFRTT